MRLPACRILRRGAEVRGRRFVWWASPPLRARLPHWWWWTISLAGAIAAEYVANRCASGHTWADWPPRLDNARPA